MSNNNGFLKKAAIAGAVAGATSAAVGNWFIETFLSKSGIKKIIKNT